MYLCHNSGLLEAVFRLPAPGDWGGEGAWGGGGGGGGKGGGDNDTIRYSFILPLLMMLTDGSCLKFLLIMYRLWSIDIMYNCTSMYIYI